jgi:transcriptional regulator with XRE-family HTH domain
MLSLKLSSPNEVLLRLAERARRRRLDANLTQQQLADRAQISLGTLKLFERTGRASVEFVVRLAFVLNAEKEFDSLFPPQEPRSIDDVIAKSPRRRARRS